MADGKAAQAASLQLYVRTISTSMTMLLVAAFAGPSFIRRIDVHTSNDAVVANTAALSNKVACQVSAPRIGSDKKNSRTPRNVSVGQRHRVSLPTSRNANRPLPLSRMRCSKLLHFMLK